MTQREIKITKHIFVNLLLTLNYVIKHHLFWLFISGLNKGQSSWLSTCLHHIIMFIYIQRVSVLTWAVSARSWQRCLTKCSALRAVSNSVCLEQHCSHNSLCLSSLSWRIKKTHACVRIGIKSYLHLDNNVSACSIELAAKFNYKTFQSSL